MCRKSLTILAVMLLVLWSSVPGAEPQKEHPDVAAIKKQYHTDMEPVLKRYRARLEALQKELTRKGDLQGALAVKVELDQLGSPDKSVPALPTSIEGTWIVTYASGAKRTYTFRNDGTVFLVETNSVGRLSRQGDDVLLDFNDNKLERLTLKQTIGVEHFNPKALYASGQKPEQTGIAEKSK